MRDRDEITTLTPHHHRVLLILDRHDPHVPIPHGAALWPLSCLTFVNLPNPELFAVRSSLIRMPEGLRLNNLPLR